MSALFNFHSFLTVVLLVISTCTFLKMQFPSMLQQKTGTIAGSAYRRRSRASERFRGFFWKAARIGERLSPWVAAGFLSMGLSILLF